MRRRSIYSGTLLFLIAFSVVTTFLMVFFFRVPDRQAIDQLKQEGFILVEKEGAYLPNIPLDSLKGEQTSLYALANGWKLINLWASWCVPCVEELPSLQALTKKLDPATFQVVAINFGEPAKTAAKFWHEQALSLPTYLDTTMASGAWLALVGEKLAPGLPQTYLVDPSFEIRALILGKTDWEAERLVSLFQQISK